MTFRQLLKKMYPQPKGQIKHDTMVVKDHAAGGLCQPTTSIDPVLRKGEMVHPFCSKAPYPWKCKRMAGHDGPCAAVTAGEHDLFLDSGSKHK